ncbi:hypothetical protein BpHYR1_036311 [Brachionus plicatilis]|uniref:Uncharacterized protein n=1 Tax=Brachionus plicatilis TaxID=10195 RepID=A0A3M7SL25_BRAPC|nr:hypothetical protein BpHYR1_036311 [Brachionus plicatilis]
MKNEFIGNMYYYNFLSITLGAIKLLNIPHLLRKLAIGTKTGMFRPKMPIIQHLVSITCPQTRIVHLNLQPRKPTSSNYFEIRCDEFDNQSTEL